MGAKVRERPAGSGIWWIFIDHQGDRKAKKIGKDKKLAVEAARKIEAKLALGDLGVIEDKPKPPLFKEYAQLWLEGYIKPLRRDTTTSGIIPSWSVTSSLYLGKCPLTN